MTHCVFKMIDKPDVEKPDVEKPGDEKPGVDLTTNSIASSVPFPPFWSTMPEVWFIQMEACFKIKKIKLEEHQFFHTVSCLPVSIISIVSDVLTNMDEPNKYTVLKDAILKRKSINETQRLEMLLDGSSIGDRSPSQFFRDLKATAGVSALATEEFIKALWLKRLPEHMRTIIATREAENIEQLCDLADKIWNISTSSSKISSVQSSERNELSELKDSISAFQDRLNNMENTERKSRSLKSSNSYTRFKSPNRRSPSRTRTKLNTKNPCWYHWQYGHKATKCNGGSCTFDKRPFSENN